MQIGSLQILISFLQEYAVIHHAKSVKARFLKRLEQHIGADAANSLDPLFFLNLESLQQLQGDHHSSEECCAYLDADSILVVEALGKRGSEYVSNLDHLQGDQGLQGTSCFQSLQGTEAQGVLEHWEDARQTQYTVDHNRDNTQSSIMYTRPQSYHNNPHLPASSNQREYVNKIAHMSSMEQTSPPEAAYSPLYSMSCYQAHQQFEQYPSYEYHLNTNQGSNQTLDPSFGYKQPVQTLPDQRLAQTPLSNTRAHHFS
jgi:hypothetical protein